MTPLSFVKRAMEGGACIDIAAFIAERGDTPEAWEAVLTFDLYEILLDPSAWKAVGKVQYRYANGSVPDEKTLAGIAADDMHQMIDALAEGKTIEQYLETL